MSEKAQLDDKINGYIRKKWFKFKMSAMLWISTHIVWGFRRQIGVWAFAVAHKVQKWNQEFYDEYVKAMYIDVRQKEAFELKTKIIDTRKDGIHVKLLILQTPERELEITLSEQQFPKLYNTSKKVKNEKHP